MQKFVQKPGFPNQLLSINDNFYCSYNPMALMAHCAETALVSKGPRMFYVLDGDYRKEFEFAYDRGGVDLLIEVAITLREHEGEWSEAIDSMSIITGEKIQTHSDQQLRALLYKGYQNGQNANPNH